ncbi:MAG: rhamnulokinase family protein [Phycisphaeraceae bacterium]
MPTKAYLAFDLGAESGRAMLAHIDGQRVELTEVHRFPNTPQRLPSGYHWNLLELWANLVTGLKRGAEIARERGLSLVSLGVDTWGVDFALVGQSGQLLHLPHAYRDERCHAAKDKAFNTLGAEAIYDATGIQFLPFNTLYQLIAQYDAEPASVDHAARLLNIPDLLHYFFSGEQVNEATIASTTQMLDPRTGKWHAQLLEQLGLPTHMLRDPVPAGTRIGQVRRDLLDLAGLDALDVIVPGSHDTASAVAAVPVIDAEHGGWAYLSSGTWSLMGVELDEPLITDASRRLDFTNERGVGDRIRFLKNIAGLWLVQQVQRDYAARGSDHDYPTLTRLAGEAQPFRTLIDPDHAPFAAPGDMCAKINAYAGQTGQPAPTSPGQYVRCCLESLALRYRQTLDGIEQLTGERITRLHVVGGGGKNELLDQMTADALGRPVYVGPYEATAMGNALTQAMGAGDIASLAELRGLVAASVKPKRFDPIDASRYEDALDRFAGLTPA